MHPGLNLNNLKYFYDAAELESISEAAKKNFVTQSAVSQGIQKLEKALSVSLITHQRNHFKLTPEGWTVFTMAQQIFKTLKAMSDIAQENLQVVSGEVHLSCTQSIATNLIANVLQRLKEEYPQITIKMKVAKMEQICSMLKRGTIDFGIAVENQLCDPFEKYLISEGIFSVFHKKGLKGKITQGVYVDHINGLYVDRLCADYKKKFKKEIIILQELDSWQLLSKCAENGIGFCFLPDFLLPDKTAFITSENIDPVPYRIVAIHPKGVHLTKAAKAFLGLLLQT